MRCRLFATLGPIRFRPVPCQLLGWCQSRPRLSQSLPGTQAGGGRTVDSYPRIARPTGPGPFGFH
eukprot:4467479-Lingulodinium_polyedra.AAC.1